MKEPFDVLKEMSQKSGDKIRSCNHNNIISVDMKGAHATLKIAIDHDTAMQIAQNKFGMAAIFYDHEEFKKMSDAKA